MYMYGLYKAPTTHHTNSFILITNIYHFFAFLSLWVVLNIFIRFNDMLVVPHSVYTKRKSLFNFGRMFSFFHGKKGGVTQKCYAIMLFAFWHLKLRFFFLLHITNVLLNCYEYLLYKIETHNYKLIRFL